MRESDKLPLIESKVEAGTEGVCITYTENNIIEGDETYPLNEESYEDKNTDKCSSFDPRFTRVTGITCNQEDFYYINAPSELKDLYKYMDYQ